MDRIGNTEHMMIRALAHKVSDIQNKTGWLS